MGTYRITGASAFNRNCVTGAHDHLYEYLKEAIAGATAIDMNVSFLMASGVRLMLDDLKAATDSGVPIRILCADYLNITQPEALYLLRDALGDRLDLRFYNVPNQSFHAKAYFFRYPDYEEVFVGSSNLSKSALTTGIEWNYRINSREQPADCAFFRQTFESLLANHSRIIDDTALKKYSKQWIRPKIIQQIEEIEEERLAASDPAETPDRVAQGQAAFTVDTEAETPAPLISFPQPSGAQIEALYALKHFRQENMDKGLIVAATGIGKTFLAAFDSKAFKRILFVAHRDEILTQAEHSFQCVRYELSTGRFDGIRKDTDPDIIFASVQTLGNPACLNADFFAPDTFDYIIIDEFHHAVSDYYQNIIDYFRPKFLLGLTATPERLDNQDVFALCDYNVVYEVRLKEAINRGWLVPFRYYGIYDDMDYAQVDFRNGRYDDDQLEKLASVSRRGNLIFQNYSKYRSRRALGFCINRRHALYMTDYFRNQGINCCAVISGPTDGDSQPLCMPRDAAIKALKTGALQVIFSVDMFNEGLDIPELDMVLFLRPTQSPTVFLQQLGRGLRKSRGKNHVNVLDFIGNYRKANLVPLFLTSLPPAGASGPRGFRLPAEDDYPEDCIVDFDFRLIDLFRKMEQDQKKISDRVSDEFYRIRAALGRRPLRLDMYVHLDAAVYAQIRSRKALNFFRDYLGFLDETGQTTPEEKELIGTAGHAFLRTIENTAMSKTYKMPVLLAFYNEGSMKLAVTEDDLYRSFKTFYEKGSNRVDLLRDKSTAAASNWGKREYVSLANRNPVHFLAQSAGEFFIKTEDRFCLAPELAAFITNPVFVRHFKDIIDYRTKRFYRERLEKLEP
ncbi:NgoFVII family restriction endonuclease [Acetobacterium fimetarium]|uniref:NgoFVII family restriction endonuclease n=1 Tax=Acetobacterium fimetarium TaxID=52691 RepID=A0ABR6WRI6_9FIRM|nr:DEAD/DEAH box helicase family protein [Acetobacterium fimetarium]MBC3802963.1 NgoFVII family restriction endonuclease [Acetobacterium fimetarium]